MQGLADGYFIIPYTIGDYLARMQPGAPDPGHADIRRDGSGRAGAGLALLAVNGSRTVDAFHRELGKIMWDECGMARNAEGLKAALDRIPPLREEFWRTVRVLRNGRGTQSGAGTGGPGRRLPGIRRADVPGRAAPGRVVRRAFPHRASDGRRRGEAGRRALHLRRRPGSMRGRGSAPVLHREPLVFENVQLATRSYK